MKRRLVVHPLLMSVFPILTLFVHNVNVTDFRVLGLPILISLLSTAILWGILTPILRSVSAAGLITSLFLLLFHSYGHFFSLVGGFAIGPIVLGRARYLLPVWILILAVGIFFIIRTRRSPRIAGVTYLANNFTIFIVSLSLIQLAYIQLDRGFFHGSTTREASVVKNAYALPDTSANANRPVELKANRVLPDIYYIILDSYVADSTLMEFFQYDNSPLTDFLKSKGFFVASNSTSNYAFTTLSLASSMNMQYLNFLTDKMGEKSTDLSLANQMLTENKVMAFLKLRGYTLINFGSWWGPTFMNRSADVNFQSSPIDEFTMKVLEGTLFLPFIEEFRENDLRGKVLFAFERLGEIPLIKAPTFSLVHFICPHPPFVFGPDGEKVSTLRRVLSMTDSRALYLDQVIFMNKKLKAVVEKILTESSTPPIIIIQGDHGSAYINRTVGRSGILPDEAYLKEQMRIFNAYYLPGAEKGVVNDSITPVNTFRAVFNAYFDAQLPMLKNENFYSGIDLPFSFSNVTETVRYRGGPEK